MRWWDRLMDFMVSEAVSLEERAAWRAEAKVLLQEERRLKLKNDLTEARIAARKERAESWKLVAVWRFDHKQAGKPVTSIVWLEHSATHRRIRGHAIISREAGKQGRVIEPDLELGPFLTSQPIFTRYLRPWLNSNLTTKALRDADPSIEVVLPSSKDV